MKKLIFIKKWSKSSIFHDLYRQRHGPFCEMVSLQHLNRFFFFRGLFMGVLMRLIARRVRNHHPLGGLCFSPGKLAEGGGDLFQTVLRDNIIVGDQGLIQLVGGGLSHLQQAGKLCQIHQKTCPNQSAT